ncbi:MAG: hypothetical protein LC104_03665 [Bacteroidales bacterium]|nr:hypothetical protein [Bacteroidales bacterium]
MSTKPPTESPEAKQRFTRQIDDAFEAASKLAGSTLAPAEFYQQFLNRTLSAIDAPAGAVWLRTPQGFLQIACQENLEQVGLDSKRGGRQCHNEILRQVFQSTPIRPIMLEPQGRLTGLSAEPGSVPAANLTDYWTLFAPIASAEKDKPPLGLLEVFQTGDLDPRMYATFLNYAYQMAGYAAQYHQFSNARQSSGLERIYAQVESFAKLIHTSLNPTEVAYHIANEGRRLVECDRLCVGVRHGSKTTVEAVSGADVVEKASSHVRRMRRLFDEVTKLGEKLVYKGEKDEGLPPRLSEALDDYLAESQPKLLVVLPIRDEREAESKKPPRSILLMEVFNPPEQVEPMIQRLEVVGKHAAPALYNAAELKRIPFGFLWRPLAKLQEGLGGKHRFIALGIGILVTALILALVLVPYPLKMEADGEFMPRYVTQVFSPYEGDVRGVLRHPGDLVRPGAPVISLYSPDLGQKYMEADSEASKNEEKVRAIEAMLTRGVSTQDELRLRMDMETARATAKAKRVFQTHLREMYHLVGGNQSGIYTANAGQFEDAATRGKPDAAWKVLSADNTNELMHRTVRPNEPLIRLGYTDGPWRVELKLPQRSIGHVLKALGTPGEHKVDAQGEKYLDVDVLLTSAPDRSYPGRLYEEDIAAEAVPNRDDRDQSEPIVQAYVRVNIDGTDAASQIPQALFVAGQEVHTRVRCGNHALGYSLFHGVWEWFYENVIFLF